MKSAEFHSSRQFAAVADGRISYVERGRGPAALFLHGLPLCGYQWRGALEDLSAMRRCIAPDLMGLGYSEAAAGRDLSFAAQARMLSEFLDALEIDAVDLCGNDTGGGISQIFAARYPRRVRTLTLTNCEVYDRWPNAMLTGFYKGVASGAFASGIRSMLEKPERAQVQFGMAFEYPERLTPDLVALYLQPLVASPQRVEQLRQFSGWETNRTQLIE
ncbi:MAG: alpha/beta fold hydrolase, partial [Candidatus Binataceae bacterium]